MQPNLDTVGPLLMLYCIAVRPNAQPNLDTVEPLLILYCIAVRLGRAAAACVCVVVEMTRAHRLWMARLSYAHSSASGQRQAA